MRRRSWAITVSLTLAIAVLTGNLWLPARAESPLSVEPPYKLSGKDPDPLDETFKSWEGSGKLRGNSSVYAPAADQFGYQLDDTQPMQWITATTGTLVSFPYPADDQYAGPIDIGFDFKFYEEIYQQLYLSTNGLVTFGEGYDSPDNQPLPQETSPNNLIAPFWDDLNLTTGQVYYKLVQSSTPKYLVIEWRDVVRFGTSDLLTFEVILYDTGDILFQYLSLNGSLDSASVGIEDKDGASGLLYLYDAPGLSTEKAVRIIHPGASARAKLLPGYQSGFVTGGQGVFGLAVSNIGDLGADTFAVSAPCSQTGWQVSLFEADGFTPLADSDHDGQLDTGPLMTESTDQIVIRVTPPSSAAAPDYLVITPTVTSTLNPAMNFSARVQVAMPLPFSQAYADSESGMLMKQVWQGNTFAARVSPYYTGSTLSLVGTMQGGYVYAWEENGYKSIGGESVYFSELMYTQLHPYGHTLFSPRPLTQNTNLATPDLTVMARYPALASAPDGKTGVLWEDYLRRQSISHTETKSNLYLSALDSQGNPSVVPLDLTGNLEWRGDPNPGAPYFSSPRMIATHDNKFVLVWLKNHLEGAGTVSELTYSVYTTLGIQVTAPTVITQSIAGSTVFIDPTLIEASNDILVAFTVLNRVSGTYTLLYGRYNLQGQVVSPFNPVPGTSAWGALSARLANNKILLAWTNPAARTVATMLLNEAGDTILKAPEDLPLVDLRRPDYISLTTDQVGHVVLTWLDAEWNDFIYYAALGNDGSLVTPPMIFSTGQAANPLVQTSVTGQSLAPYSGVKRLYIPVACR